MSEHYDAIFVGSGFASMFYLQRLLQQNKIKRALVVERGRHNTLRWQIDNDRNTPPQDEWQNHIEQTGMPGKNWVHSIGVGGGSNCWWANTMRIHPDEFQLKSRFGVGVDWPVSYDELEQWYCDAEEIISVSGDEDSASIFPRSRPFPQPRHRFSRIARAFKDRYPEHFFQMPQARSRIGTALRNPCCANDKCGTCPVNAKFTVLNDLSWVLVDPRVTLVTETRVDQIVVEGGVAKGVEGQGPGGAFRATGDFVVLGANGVYNPFILLKSGIDHGPVGRGLTEQVPIYIEAELDGLEGGDGSSFIAGAGYNFTSGEFRREAAGGFYEIINLPRFRLHPTKYRCFLSMVFMIDDLRQEDRNYVTISESDPNKPRVHFEDWSPYAHAGVERVKNNLESFLGHLPIESLRAKYAKPGGHAHLQGTAVMGHDPNTSVVDARLLHHKVRNLAVVGSSAFPTASAMNPTLTIAALSLKSAAETFG